MLDIASLIFLLIGAYQDEKSGHIGWFLIISFFLAALWFNADAWWMIATAYVCCCAIAYAFDKAGMAFGGGDIKSVAVLAGLSGIGAGMASLALAMAIWRVSSRYPHRVAFVPYLAFGYLLYKFIVNSDIFWSLNNGV